MKGTIRFVGIGMEPSDEDVKAGVEGYARFEVRIPVGEDGSFPHPVSVPITRSFEPGGVRHTLDDKPIWQWDGSEEKPTLHPSLAIGDVEQDGWRAHFFLRKGVIVPCVDCTLEVVDA